MTIGTALAVLIGALLLYSAFGWTGLAAAMTILVGAFIALSLVNRIRMKRRIDAIFRNAKAQTVVASPEGRSLQPTGEAMIDEHDDKTVMMLADAFIEGERENLDDADEAGELAYKAAIIYGHSQGWTAATREEMAHHVKRRVVWTLTSANRQ